jgi:hypothetical protein
MLKILGGIPDSLHNRGSDRIGSWRAKVCQMQKGGPPAREIHKRQLEGGYTKVRWNYSYSLRRWVSRKELKEGLAVIDGFLDYADTLCEERNFSSQLSAKDQRTRICFNGRLIS